ncbi:trypsin-like serine protease [Nonomuraea spiralis]|uniref:trypsin-like serine protease n=1 Tax=Nonomuraea spiralis TaxID=46182 RepID=UPI0037BD5509
MASLTKLDRVVSFEEDGDFIGSGYLLAPDLILTCAHLFGKPPRPGAAFARLSNDERHLEIDTVFPHREYRPNDDRYDLALVTLRGPATQDGSTARIGRLDKGTGRVPCDVVGFTTLDSRDFDWHRRHVFVNIALGTFEAPELLDLNVDSGLPEWKHVFYQARPYPADRSPWSGISGAPVLPVGEDLVVGVCTGHASPSLVAASTVGLEEDPTLSALLAERGLRVERYPATAGTVIAEPPDLMPYEETAAALTGTDAYLKGLRFVSPGHQHRARPANLLAALESETHGVLVTGPAGSGKSRICLETASKARQDGWLVLHQHPAARPTVERLVEAAVNSGSDRVLIVADEVSPDFSLDPHAIPAALAQAGVTDRPRRVAVLAAAGPTTFATLRGREVAQRFRHVTVPDAEPYLRDVQDVILRTVAPEALKVPQWGFDGLAGLCGLRPGLAVLIASEFETRRGGQLLVPRRSRLPGGELSKWLLTHLRADGLLPATDEGSGTGAAPEPYLLAAAAAVCACPQPRADIEAAARRLLLCLRETALTAESVVDLLLSRGWLEERDGRLHSLHDVVTEELLRSCLLTPSGETLQGAQADLLMDAVLTGVTTFAHFAHRLRAMSAGYPEEKLPPLLERLCGQWLERNATNVGALLRAAGGAQDAEQALLALVAGPPWQDATTRHWDAVAGPCLRAAESEQRAPVILRNALRSCPKAAPVPLPLVESALDWLERSPGHTGTPELLGALLVRLRPGAAGEDRCRAQAVAWLSEHSLRPTASHVLQQLLTSTALSAEESEQAAAAAVRWLARYGDKPEASFVLGPLLQCPDLAEPLRAQSAECALAWLRRHDRHPNATFVLRPMLSMDGIRARHFDAAVTHTLNWFVAHGTENSAFQMAKLLLKPRAGRSATDAVLTWLDTHHARWESLHVVKEVARLKEKDISPAQARRAIGHALVWLGARSEPERAHCERREAKEVIHALAARGRRRKTSEEGSRVVDRMEFRSGQADEVARYAANWMDVHGVGMVPALLLSSMLGFWHCGPEQGQRISAHALAWLNAHEDDLEYGVVLGELLRRGQLSGLQARQAVERARWWLRQPDRQYDAVFYEGLLKLLKKYAAQDPEVAARVPGLVDAVLGVPHPVRLSLDRARFLLGVPGLTEDQVDRIVPAVLDWLELHVEHPRSDFVLRSLLRRDDLRRAHARGVIDLAFAWLHHWNDMAHAKTVHDGPALVLTGLLRRPELAGSLVTRAVKLAFDWMSAWFRQNSGLNRNLLGALLSRPELPPETMADVLQRALHWRGQDIVLSAPGEGEESGPELEEHAFAWLDVHHGSQAAGRVIGALTARLLRAEDVDPASLDRAAGHAPAWLRDHPEDFDGRFILPSLLDHHDRFPAYSRELVDLTLHWLVRHHAAFGARQVLRHLLDHPGLTQEERERATRYAFAWLAEFGTNTKASFVLRPLAQIPLDHDQERLLTDLIVTWSSLMVSRLRSLGENNQLRNPSVERPDPRYVLRVLLVRAGLAPEHLARALGAALAARFPPGLPPRFEWELPGPEGGGGSLPEFAFARIGTIARLPEAGEVIAELLRSSDLEDRGPHLIDVALGWLGAHGGGPEAVQVCSWLLKSLRPPMEGYDAAARFSVQWLESHPADANSTHLLQHLLRRTSPRSAAAAASIGHAVAWLGVHGGEYAAGRVLAPLLSRADLAPDDAAIGLRHAMDWLAAYGSDARAHHVLRGVLACDGLSPAQQEQAVRIALAWVRADDVRPAAAGLLVGCLGLAGLPAGLLRDACGLALAWLGARAGSPASPTVVLALLRRTDLDGEQAAQVRRCADASLAGRLLNRPAGALLAAYLARPDAPPSLIAQALAWLDEWSETPEADQVLIALLDRPELGTKDARHAARMVLQWADEHDDSPSVPRLAGLLTARGDLTAYQREQALGLPTEARSS